MTKIHVYRDGVIKRVLVAICLVNHFRTPAHPARPYQASGDANSWNDKQGSGDSNVKCFGDDCFQCWGDHCVNPVAISGSSGFFDWSDTNAAAAVKQNRDVCKVSQGQGSAENKRRRPTDTRLYKRRS